MIAGVFFGLTRFRCSGLLAAVRAALTFAGFFLAAVFVAPPADLTLHADLALDTLGFGRRARQLVRERIERRLGVPWSALDVAGFAPRMPTPLLVLHDRDDAEVPWQEGAIIAPPLPSWLPALRTAHRHRGSVPGFGLVRWHRQRAEARRTIGVHR